MNTTTEQDYRVLITQSPPSNGNSGQHWSATLLGFPFIAEEAASRDQAIEKLEARLVDMVARAEIITLKAPALPMASVASNGNDDKLITNGWDDYGLYKDDPDALRVFDEIERERDRYIVLPQKRFVPSWLLKMWYRIFLGKHIVDA